MRLVHGRPQGRPFFFCPLPALLLAGACASLPPAAPPVVRSSLGDVAAPALRAALQRAARERPELAAWPADPAVARGFLEEWLFAEALAQEARREGLDTTPGARATLAGVRREALAKVLEQRLEAALPPPTDEQVEAFLRANVALVRRGERLSLRHVFKRVAVQAPAGERARVRAEVEALRQRAIQGGDFGQLAREQSDSETAKFDGQIAPQARGQLPASVEDVVWSLAPGEISGVVETPIGFHVFRLEARLPADELPADEQRAWARLRLQHQARAEARRREHQRLLAASGAHDASAALPPWRAEPATEVFRLGPDTLTVADLLRAREQRGFAERHRASLPELAEPETWRRLLAWRADHEGLWRDPDVAAAVDDAERAWLAEQAYARRLARWQGALPETELRAFFDGNPRRFDEPARLRLRVAVLHRAPGASPHASYERLAQAARQVRAGQRELADVAREISEDESAAAGGDLGAILPRDLAEWAGTTTLDRVQKLPVGELGGPFLLEIYREQQLAYVPEGHLLARVEERLAARPRSFEEARTDVMATLARDQALLARQAIRADVFREIGAELHPEWLTATPAAR